MSEATQRLQAARLSLAQGDAATAHACCLKILEHSPEEPGALHLLGVIAYQRGEILAAGEYLRRAAEAIEEAQYSAISRAIPLPLQERSEPERSEGSG